jgi:hypothetical protein
MREFLYRLLKAHPDYAASVTPATDADVAALEKVAGPLPDAYKDFLRVMGREPGDLAFPPRSSFRYEDVFKLHYAAHNARRKAERKGKADKKRRADDADGRRLMIGSDVGCDDPHAYYVDLSDPVNLPVFEDSDCCGRRGLAGSLLEYLFSRRFRREVFEHGRTGG